MRTAFVLSLSIAMLAAPFALAHEPAGTPKTYCEWGYDWRIHDWNQDPPATSLTTKGADRATDQDLSHGWNAKYMWPYMDGNLEDCDGDFNPSDPYCLTEEVAREDLNGDGRVCEASEYDGHKEFGYVGSALFLADDGDMLTYGSLVCWAEHAHHPYYGPFTVSDAVLGGVWFTVGADVINVVGPDPITGLDCGDFSLDDRVECFYTCSVTFRPGRDGAYHVVVNGGTQGHAVS